MAVVWNKTKFQLKLNEVLYAEATQHSLAWLVAEAVRNYLREEE